MEFKCTCGADKDDCIDCMKETIDKLVAALEAVEWVGYGTESWRCPQCRNTTDEGHLKGCFVGDALKLVKGK